MLVDRELLWKAYPAGYVGTKGVSTVSHWLCRWATGNIAEFILDTGTGKGIRKIMVGPHEDGTVGPWKERWDDHGEHAAGHLLPRVDPSQTATWACLLLDLVSACWTDEIPRPTERWWIRSWRPALLPLVDEPQAGVEEHWSEGWVLEVSWGYMGVVNRFFSFYDLNTDDPALALVLARIQRREKGR